VLALFVGYWLEHFLAPGVRARAARLALVAAAFAYSAASAAIVDYAMSVDSRYALTGWLREHARPGDEIGTLGPLDYVMLREGFPAALVGSADDLAAQKPPYVVLNVDQMATWTPRVQAMYQSLVDGRAGYRLAGTFRTPMPPLPGLHPDLGAEPRHGPEFSDLAMINPKMEVFERIP
jgi:hypothetical protein